MQGLQPGVNRAGVAAQKLIQALPQRAACAPARAVLGTLAASRAGVPVRRGADAGPAERAGGRPAANQPDVAAAGAACAPLLAVQGVAPRLAGDLGDHPLPLAGQPGRQPARLLLAPPPDYVCDPRYGWVSECEQRAGAVPVQVFHERNFAAHVCEREGRPGRRLLTRAELQAFFDAADDHVEKAAGA